MRETFRISQVYRIESKVMRAYCRWCGRICLCSVPGFFSYDFHFYTSVFGASIACGVAGDGLLFALGINVDPIRWQAAALEESFYRLGSAS